ncbi:MAG: hypothetical protein JW971_05140, partial [Synergistales bacterium]|nr:hypothetical protein [Synergistales bacterium]
MKNCSKRTLRYSVSCALFVFLLALFISFGGTAVYSATYTVKNTNNSGLNSLREAIEAANDNDEVDEITFNVTGIITLSSQLQISSGMTIQGPGAEDLAVSGNDTCRVFYINTTESVDISGISIVSGDAGGNDGGGIWNNCDKLTLTDCTVSYNVSDMYGGGMYNEDCDPTITNCNFSVNSADNDGGGMYNLRSSPDITNCNFAENIAG